MLVFILQITVSCTKPDELNVAYRAIDLPTNAPIRSVAKVDNNYVFVGGDNSGKGFVIQTDRALNSKQMIKDDFELPIYSIGHTGSEFIFGLGEAQIIYSDSLKEFKYHFFQQENWVNDQYKLPLRQILIDSHKWIMSGGGDFQFGYTYVSSDFGESWQPSEFANEVHAITFTENGKIAAVGNGIVVTSFDGLEWNRQRLNNVLLTGSSQNLVCSFSGDFYRVHNEYQKFTKLSVDGSPRFLINLIAISHPIYSHVAVGMQGNIAWVEHSGKISGGVLKDDVDFLDAILYNQEQMLLTGNDGKLYLVDFP